MKNTMTAVMAAAVVSVAVTAAAQPDRFDSRLERAAAEILAAKVGALRGTFGLDERPVVVTAENMAFADLPLGWAENAKLRAEAKRAERDAKARDTSFVHMGD